MQTILSFKSLHNAFKAIVYTIRLSIIGIVHLVYNKCIINYINIVPDLFFD